MSDIRRSSRANKGKNSRLEEQVRYEELMSKKAKKDDDNGDENSDDGDEDGEVLCTVCGTTDDNYDESEDDRDMIQCEECLSWQHSECIFGKKPVPDLYKCNVCDPNNILYKDLVFELDPETIMLKSKKHKSSTGKKKNKVDDYKDKGGEDDDEDDEVQDVELSDGPEENLSDDDYKVKRESLRKRSRSRSDDSIKTAPKKPRSRQSSTNDVKIDEIESKARDAVRKRFEGMFTSLFKLDTKSVDDQICSKWSILLEDELFKVYHNPENGKLTPLYKEVSTRLFVNIKDEKNVKLRDSILNKQISFSKLVKMPVSELLNPDLQREKEEAIKESMTQATLEAPKISNIRRTHKGDILLEKDSDNLSNQQFDFNVGLNLDKEELEQKNFEDNNIIDRKNSTIYDGHNNNDDDDDDSYNYNDDNEGNDNKDFKTIDEDEALLKILGETEKDVQNQNDSKINELINKKLYEGQTIFVGITNFASEVRLLSTNLQTEDLNKIHDQLFDINKPIEIEGRLDLKKVESYLEKVSSTRKLIMMELNNTDDNDKNFMKLFNYFNSRSKCGVVKLNYKQSFIKDGYIIALNQSKSLPKFLKLFPNLKVNNDNPRIFITFVIKQEMIAKIQTSPSNNQETNVPSNEFLSNLSPQVLELVNKIFDEIPETRINSNLLIDYLKKKLSGV